VAEDLLQETWVRLVTRSATLTDAARPAVPRGTGFWRIGAKIGTSVDATSPARAAPMIGTRVSHYLVIEKLGEGGMGVVYKAQDLKLERPVALKFLGAGALGSTKQRERFVREARAAAALDHPNICPVYEIDEHEGQLFIAMAFAEGVTLKDRLAAGPLPPAEAVHIALQVAKALEVAHAKGVVHRDVKSANVLVTPLGHARITDFGLALVRHAGGTADSTAIVGTPAYMSPEQISGQPLDDRTDIWSWGVVFYEMLTGCLPFQGEHVMAVAEAILRSEPRAPSAIVPAVPAAWDRVVRKALAKRTADRFANASELVALLELPTDQIAVTSAARWAETPRAQPRIAVLPFVDMSPGRDQDYFCEGLAEEIIADLTRLRGLQVVSRTSSFAFRGRLEDVREIGRKLGADKVLEGSVRKVDTRLRVTAQLIDTMDGLHLWSERYDRELRDVFAIQEEIAKKIVQALRVELSEKERRQLARTTTPTVDAYDFFLRGLQFFYRTKRRDLEHAIEMFRKASETDPSFARADAGLAYCHCYLFFYHGGEAVHLEQALEASKRALHLDPDLADAHTAHAYALSLGKRHDDAETEFEVAIALDEYLFEAYFFYGRMRVAQGRFEHAAELFRKAVELKPDDHQAATLWAFALKSTNRPEECEAAWRETLDRARRYVSLNLDDARGLYAVAQSLAELGQREECLEWAHRMIALAPDDPYILYGMVCILARIGEIDEAVAYFERAVRRGFVQRAWIENDADLEPIRGHPTYEALVASLP
jgi:non-specific serine/threonine protein kinase